MRRRSVRLLRRFGPACRVLPLPSEASLRVPSSGLSGRRRSFCRARWAARSCLLSSGLSAMRPLRELGVGRLEDQPSKGWTARAESLDGVSRRVRVLQSCLPRYSGIWAPEARWALRAEPACGPLRLRGLLLRPSWALMRAWASSKALFCRLLGEGEGKRSDLLEASSARERARSALWATRGSVYSKS